MRAKPNNPLYGSIEDKYRREYNLVRSARFEVNNQNDHHYFATTIQFKKAVGYYELFLEEADLVERSRKREVAFLNYIEKKNHLKRDKEGDLLKIQPSRILAIPVNPQKAM